MTPPRIDGLRSVELAVPDLAKSAAFYRDVWGLREVTADGDAVHMRGTGQGHHAVTLRQAGKASLLGVHFSAPDRASIDALHAQIKAMGANVDSPPAVLPASEGGGYGFRLRTPEGHPLSISAGVAAHGDALDDPSAPIKLSHVVLNSADVPQQTAFFRDVLGFTLSDSTQMMDFIRCCSDHHSIAFARGSGPSLNHMAYEMTNIDGLMRGAGRLRKSGFDIEWGVGRHGPGDNVFSYFVEPNGFVAEYTTEVQQIDDAYEFHDAKWWADLKIWPCRWNMAGPPTARARHAMSGKLVEENNMRCEEIMAARLGR